MSGPTTVPAPAVTSAARAARATKTARPAGGRRDSTPKRIVIHGVLILAAVIAAFPIIRVLSVALRPGNRILESEFQLIPEGASFTSFVDVLTTFRPFMKPEFQEDTIRGRPFLTDKSLFVPTAWKLYRLTAEAGRRQPF